MGFYSSKTLVAFIAMLVLPIFMFGQNMLFQVLTRFKYFFTMWAFFLTFPFYIITSSMNIYNMEKQTFFTNRYICTLITNKKFFIFIFWWGTSMNSLMMFDVRIRSSEFHNT